MTQTLNGTGEVAAANGAGEIAAANQAYIQPPADVSGRLWRWTLRLAGQIRRQYLSRLRPGYVTRMKGERLGTCRGCGSCCDLTFHCPFLTDDYRCDRYEKRTRTCRDFPIDARDLDLTRVPCGHYFAAGAAGAAGAEESHRANSAG